MNETYYSIAKKVYSIDFAKDNTQQTEGIISFTKELLMKVQPWKNNISLEVQCCIEDNLLMLNFSINL